MEFHGQLGDLDSYYLERRELEVRNRTLQAEIRRLGQGADCTDAVDRCRLEMGANGVRVRALTCLIDRIRLQICMR